MKLLCPECGWENFRYATAWITICQCTKCKTLSYIPPHLIEGDIQNYEGCLGRIKYMIVVDE